MNSPEIVTAIIEALEKASIEYAVVGSFSSNFYGKPRSTADLDLVVHLPNIDAIRSIALHLPAQFKLARQMSFELVTGTNRFELEIEGTAFKVEFFILSSDLHDQARFSRRKQVVMDDLPLFVPSVEDVIITKLRWARPKDIEDIEEILLVGYPLDEIYLSKWCTMHGTSDLLKSIRQAIDYSDEQSL